MKNKKFYKIVICRCIEREFEPNKYDHKSKDYYRYGYSEIDVITKLRREFNMNTKNKLIEVLHAESSCIPEDFNGKIFKHLEKSYDDEILYYEWYIEETVHIKPIKKVSIIDDFLEECKWEELKKK